MNDFVAATQMDTLLILNSPLLDVTANHSVTTALGEVSYITSFEHSMVPDEIYWLYRYTWAPVSRPIQWQQNGREWEIRAVQGNQFWVPDLEPAEQTFPVSQY
jgi:hypothetical protein